MVGGKRNKNIILVVGIVLLGFAVALLAFLNHNDVAGLQEGKIACKAGGVTVKELTVADLRKLPAVQKQIAIHSSSGTSGHRFTGTPLSGVLNSIDPQLTRSYTKIVSRGVDNYTSAVSMSEVLQPDNVYLVYADFGKPLKTMRGKDGAVQLIICNDQFGQRFTNYLVSLELQ